jgi:hypothetical protein
MQHAKEYLATMKTLEPLLREHRHYRSWHFDAICNWCAYFWNRGTIGYVIDDFGTAQGVCIIKLFARLEQFLEPFVHQPDGHFCMIELLIADGPQTNGWLLADLTQRWGWPAVMIWDRGERTLSGAPRMFTRSQFQKLARRFTKLNQEVNYGFGR